MARRIVHQLVDDLDGTVLGVGSGETVLFSLDGTAYEIDLTEENAAALRAALEPYIAAARPVTARAA
ncbi:histone-like nucleoid-structuring protein Lsr2, partial [Microbacterium sp.]|uniref:histone-like nucleoid-structuring protein Lsr2 n=1 Tax=Microbacterium sp. TaxID=51671 RepID=UPI003C76D356